MMSVIPDKELSKVIVSIYISMLSSNIPSKVAIIKLHDIYKVSIDRITVLVENHFAIHQLKRHLEDTGYHQHGEVTVEIANIINKLKQLGINII